MFGQEKNAPREKKKEIEQPNIAPKPTPKPKLKIFQTKTSLARQKLNATPVPADKKKSLVNKSILKESQYQNRMATIGTPAAMRVGKPLAALGPGLGRRLGPNFAKSPPDSGLLAPLPRAATVNFPKPKTQPTQSTQKPFKFDLQKSLSIKPTWKMKTGAVKKLPVLEDQHSQRRQSMMVRNRDQNRLDVLRRRNEVREVGLMLKRRVGSG